MARMMIRPILRLCSLGLATAAPLAAQNPPAIDLAVLVTSEDGQPIDVALVQALDTGNRLVADQVTDSAGRALLRLPAGTYRIRIERLGFRDFLSDPLRVDSPRAAPLQLRLEFDAIPVDSLFADAARRCRTPPEQGPAVLRMHLFMVEAMRKVNAVESGARVRVREILRRPTRDPATRRFDDTTHVELDRLATTPDARTLQAYGWAEGPIALNDSAVYYLPTAQTLSSVAFRDSHCYRVRDHGDSAWTALEFEPMDRGRVDVSGVIWIDTLRQRPVRLEYHYTGMTDLLARTEGAMLTTRARQSMLRRLEARFDYAASVAATSLVVGMPAVRDRDFGGWVEYGAVAGGYATRAFEITFPRFQIRYDARVPPRLRSDEPRYVLPRITATAYLFRFRRRVEVLQWLNAEA